MYGAAGLCKHAITSFLKHYTMYCDAGFKEGARLGTHVYDLCNGGRRIKKSRVARCRAQAFNLRLLHGFELEASLIYTVSSRPAKGTGEILFQKQNKQSTRKGPEVRS